MTTDPQSATFWEHLEDLRQTLIRVFFIIAVGVVLSFYFHKELHQILVSHLDKELVLLSPVEGFATMLKLSFWAGLVLTSPFWLYAVTKFIAPSLNERERAGLIPFIFISVLFASVGFLFGYTVTIPLANEFLEAFNKQVGQNMWSLQHYFDYTLTLLLAHGLAFELAAVVLFLLHYGFISASTLSKKRAYAIVAIFALAAIMTPPDIMTQLLLGIPMAALYELLILYGRFREKNQGLQRYLQN